MPAQYFGKQTIIRQTHRSYRPCKDRPQRTQHIDACSPALTPEADGERETKSEAQGLPEILSSSSSTNFIYTKFASYAAWLLGVVFFCARRNPGNATPRRDSAQQCKLQRLRDGAKSEAERGRCNTNVFGTFSSQAEVGNAEKRKCDELSNDEDQDEPVTSSAFVPLGGDFFEEMAVRHP
jgi:hypothetical protein